MKDGLHFWCRPCLKQKKSEDYQRNREARLASMAAYRKENPEKVSEAKKRCYRAKPEHYSTKRKAAYLANPEVNKANAKRWREENPERVAAYVAAYKAENREKLAKAQLSYQAENREKYNAYQLAYRLRRYATEPQYALEATCRRRILCAMAKSGFRKKSKTAEMVGCSYGFLVAHLESKFLPGMTWENRGLHGWHIDHIKPLSSAKNEEELLSLCHYTNLQPLWAFDNYSKGSKLPEDYYRDKLGQL